jgi:hypothetical protein
VTINENQPRPSSRAKPQWEETMLRKTCKTALLAATFACSQFGTDEAKTLTRAHAPWVG